MKDNLELDKCEAVAGALLQYERDMTHVIKGMESLLCSLEDISQYLEQPIFNARVLDVTDSLNQFKENADKSREVAEMIKERMWDHFPLETPPKWN